MDPVEDILHRVHQVESAITEVQQEALDLLDAQRRSWAHRHPYKMAAATGTQRGARPELRLLVVPLWSRQLAQRLAPTAQAPLGPSGQSDPAQDLAPKPLVFLQGHEADLYVRVVGAAAPASLALESRPWVGDTRSLPVTAQRVDPKARPFALPALNGGGGNGSLWHLPDVSAGLALGGDGRRLVLRVAVHADERPTPLGEVELPPLNHRRVGHEDSRPGAAERRLRSAIDAYTRPDGADDFSAAVEWFAGTGSAFRELRRWQALWMRAMLAELRRQGDRTWRQYGGPRSQVHPQLQLDSV